jgi:hypothetical protein
MTAALNGTTGEYAWACRGARPELGRVHAAAMTITRYAAAPSSANHSAAAGAPICSALCIAGGAYVQPDGSELPSREVWCSDSGDGGSWAEVPSLPVARLGSSFVALADQDVFMLVGGVAGPPPNASSLTDEFAGDVLVAGFSSASDCMPSQWTLGRAGAPVAGSLREGAL